jgi:hypothetical protein
MEAWRLQSEPPGFNLSFQTLVDSKPCRKRPQGSNVQPQAGIAENSRSDGAAPGWDCRK